jgi:hypothetical protein
MRFRRRPATETDEERKRRFFQRNASAVIARMYHPTDPANNIAAEIVAECADDSRLRSDARRALEDAQTARDARTALENALAGYDRTTRQQHPPSGLHHRA